MRKASWAFSLFGSGLLCMATGALAQSNALLPVPEARRYAVEIILFRYAGSVPNGSEIFVAEPLPALPEEFIGLPGAGNPDASSGVNDVPGFGDTSLPVGDPDHEPAEPPDGRTADDGGIVRPARDIELEVMDKSTLTLGESFEKLEQLDAYHPVLWTGWTQAALEREATPTIPLRRLGNPPAGFDGELQLYLGRFLHLVIDLTLTPQEQQDPSAYVPSYSDGRSRLDDNIRQPGVVYLEIKEDRIVKNGDLRYFDHPRFGLLAKVTRVEEEVPAAPDATDETGNPLPAGESP